MSMVATDIKDLFKIKIKARHDSYTDQYNRIFMVKILLACTIVLGISWYSDKFNCVVPGSHTSSDDFTNYVSTTCWVQGIYVYRELQVKLDSVAYYGVPKDIKDNGVMQGKYLCDAEKKKHPLYGENPNMQCHRMTKSFFLHYQYMPFFVCALALLYYIPYMISKTVNHDLINLRKAIKEDTPEIDDILKYYFKDRQQKKRCSKMLTGKQIMNTLVKVAYVVANFFAFFGTDSMFNGKFIKYGGKWIKWGQANNTVAFNYMGVREFPKPGNELLPPFGLCEVYASSKHILQTYNNKHKVLCEISQHILYQYVFVVLWFAIVTGIIVSIIGLLHLMVNYAIGFIGIRKARVHQATRKMLDTLTYREVEYLELMRKKNQIVYGEVVGKLKERSFGQSINHAKANFHH